MLELDNKYNEYLESYAWKALKEKKISDDFNCSCCWKPASVVHHLTYERLWRELENDIVSLCEICHNECHFIDDEKILNEENILRKRYEDVKSRNQKNWNKEFIVDNNEQDEIDEDNSRNNENLEKNW